MEKIKYEMVPIEVDNSNEINVQFRLLHQCLGLHSDLTIKITQEKYNLDIVPIPKNKAAIALL
jgi:hypothetical protein